MFVYNSYQVSARICKHIYNDLLTIWGVFFDASSCTDPVPFRSQQRQAYLWSTQRLLAANAAAAVVMSCERKEHKRGYSNVFTTQHNRRNRNSCMIEIETGKVQAVDRAKRPTHDMYQYMLRASTHIKI